jgi:anti-anti-sigma regulatory factor
MLRIQRSANANGVVVFKVSGQMDEEPIAELQTLISSEAKGRRIVLNLKNVTLVNEDAITFLERCESSGITLENCPPYIREWITRQRDGH